MTSFLTVNSRIYDGVLRLYPPDLRHSFGSDMAEAFGEDLRCAWSAQRFRGVLSVWWWTLWELISVGLPAHVENRFVMVPVVSFAFSTCLTMLEFAAVWFKHGIYLDPGGASLAEILFGPALLTALTSLVWILWCDEDILTSLELGPCSKPAI